MLLSPRCLLFVLVLSAVAIETAAAQTVPPRRGSRYSSGYNPPSANPATNILNRPTVSPYLNLVNGLGGSPGGYQSFVRPFTEQGNALRQQQRQIGSLQNSVSNIQQGGAATGDGTLRPTGHATSYRNYSHYFPRMPR